MDDKTVIVITVPPCPNRPYFLKSKGKENGTYIRLAGTTRPAWPDRIKDLEMEGMRISWDELTCVGFPVTDKAVKKLCRDIMKFREKADLPKRTVTKEQLINWKVLKEEEGTTLATNAFALLTSDHFFFSKTQCAVFKGTGRNVFLDKREYTSFFDETSVCVTKNGQRSHPVLAFQASMVKKESCYQIYFRSSHFCSADSLWVVQLTCCLGILKK